MPQSSLTAGRSSDSATWRRRRAGGSRITAVLAALEREVLASRELHVFGNRNQFEMEVAVSLRARRQAAGLLPRSCPRTLHDLLPSATVFLARAGRRPLGTLTLFCDGSMGLPLDAVCPRLLDPLRCGCRRIAQIGAVGLAPALAPAAARCLVTNLLKVTLTCARQLEEIGNLVAGIDPRQAGLAARYSMRPMSPEWSGLLPMHVDLEQSELGFIGRYAGLPGNRDLDRLMRRGQHQLVRWLRERRRPLEESVLLALIAERREAFVALSVEQRHAFEDAYLAYDLSEVLSRT
jgi:hypothetical protein